MDARIAVNVVMGDESDGMRTDGPSQDSPVLERADNGVGIAAAAQANDDDIALHRVEIELHFRERGQTLGQDAGVGMIFM